jgi:hypothetical protein
VRSDKRADTLADYLETVQWQVRFADVRPAASSHLGPTLAIDMSHIAMAECTAVLMHLKDNRAGGNDDVPPGLKLFCTAAIL